MSIDGTLEGIYITDAEGAAMHALNQATLIADRGIEGDRYCNRKGKFSKGEQVSPGQQVTLIEAETLEAVQRDLNIELAPAQSRRNLVTRGVPLNHLVDREFMIADVRLRGIKLCEPCGYLEQVTGMSDLRQALLHRGGLRAQILHGGVIRIGDSIAAIPDAAATPSDCPSP